MVNSTNKLGMLLGDITLGWRWR